MRARISGGTGPSPRSRSAGRPGAASTSRNVRVRTPATSGTADTRRRAMRPSMASARHPARIDAGQGIGRNVDRQIPDAWAQRGDPLPLVEKRVGLIVVDPAGGTDFE